MAGLHGRAGLPRAPATSSRSRTRTASTSGVRVDRGRRPPGRRRRSSRRGRPARSAGSPSRMGEDRDDDRKEGPPCAGIPANPILTRADIPDIPPASRRRHVGLQSRARSRPAARTYLAPPRPGPVARDLHGHGRERRRRPLRRSARSIVELRGPREGPEADLSRLRRPHHPARGGLLRHVRHGHGRRLPAGTGPDGRLPGLRVHGHRRRPTTSATASCSRRRSAACTSGSSGPTRPSSRAARPTGSGDLAGRLGRPARLAAARPGHGRALPLLGRVHRLRAAAGQDPARLAPRLSRRRDALRQRQHLPGRGRPCSTFADPAKVLGRSRGNILEPREPYELCGQVPNVVFPSGMVVEEFDAEGFALPASPVKVYYGAADTAVGLAVTTVGELLAACARCRTPLRRGQTSTFTFHAARSGSWNAREKVQKV
ncbi:MAG: hypothetical protein MZU95_01420 [Desulfomicrobium escambiense]|nr:hypothetical protein [Desulfomicrobium escambiense]